MNVVILNLDGRLDISTSSDLDRRVTTGLAAGHRHFVFDLSSVTFVDSMGMAAMLKLLKRVRQLGGDIRIVSSSSAATRRILFLTRFDKVFDIYTTMESALHNFGEPLPTRADRSAGSATRPEDEEAGEPEPEPEDVQVTAESTFTEPAGDDRTPRRIITANMEIEEYVVHIASIKPIGVLDAQTSATLKAQVQSFLSKGVVRFVIDLSDVMFVDSSGLSVLLNTLQQSRQRGGSLKLVNSGEEKLMQLLTLTRLDQMFEVYADVRSALDAFTPLS